MPRRKAAVIIPPRDTSSDEAALRTLYRKDPSRILPNPLWKTVAKLQQLECRFLGDIGAVTGVELRQPGKLLIYGTRTQDPLMAASVKLDGVPTVSIHNDFVGPLAPWFDRKEAFFRLVHTGSELPLRVTVRGYGVKQVDTTTELPLVATILHACYDTPTPGTDELVEWVRRPVFDPRSWLWIMDTREKRPVALGIAEVDKLTEEGSLEWIQVLPAFRGLGLGTMLVQEMVNRLQQEVAFTTVSGQVRNSCEPERLFRRCGFAGHDVWWILHR
ncbi:MAG: GNAT family N-acetyltransferase [Candidatus Cryosericum sp.]